MTRTAGSLNCRCTHLQRVSPKYLTENKLYRANIPSGEIEDDTFVKVMKLSRENKKTKRDGKMRLAPVLKSLNAAMLLEQDLKFSQSVGGGYSASSPGYPFANLICQVEKETAERTHQVFNPESDSIPLSAPVIYPWMRLPLCTRRVRN